MHVDALLYGVERDESWLDDRSRTMMLALEKCCENRDARAEVVAMVTKIR
jgi:hypothetical protein